MITIDLSPLGQLTDNHSLLLTKALEQAIERLIRQGSGFDYLCIRMDDWFNPYEPRTFGASKGIIDVNSTSRWLPLRRCSGEILLEIAWRQGKLNGVLKQRCKEQEV